MAYEFGPFRHSVAASLQRDDRDAERFIHSGEWRGGHSQFNEFLEARRAELDADKSTEDVRPKLQMAMQLREKWRRFELDG
eukprot:1245856-Amphidinium_carterae.1